MVTGKLVDYDFSYTIEDEVLDDYELLEILGDIDAGQAQKVTIAFKMLLGEKQLSELKEKIREKSGRVSFTEMMAAFSLIMKEQDTKKINALALMLWKYKDELICDFAEYYHIYDISSYPARYIATLAHGLREDSRVKLAISDVKIGLDTLLAASIADSCQFIAWSKTESAQNNENRPPQMLKVLLGIKEEKQSDIMSFATPEDFEEARAKLIGD